MSGDGLDAVVDGIAAAAALRDAAVSAVSQGDTIIDRLDHRTGGGRRAGRPVRGGRSAEQAALGLPPNRPGLPGRRGPSRKQPAPKLIGAAGPITSQLLEDLADGLLETFDVRECQRGGPIFVAGDDRLQQRDMFVHMLPHAR